MGYVAYASGPKRRKRVACLLRAPAPSQFLIKMKGNLHDVEGCVVERPTMSMTTRWTGKVACAPATGLCSLSDVGLYRMHHLQTAKGVALDNARLYRSLYFLVSYHRCR